MVVLIQAPQARMSHVLAGFLVAPRPAGHEWHGQTKSCPSGRSSLLTSSTIASGCNMSTLRHPNWLVKQSRLSLLDWQLLGFLGMISNGLQLRVGTVHNWMTQHVLVWTSCSNSKRSFLLMNAKTSQTTWYKKVYIYIYIQPFKMIQLDSTCMLPRSRSRGPGLSSDVIAGGVLSSASAAAAPVAAQPADRCCSLWEFERPFGAVCGSWVCIPEPPKGQWRSSKCDQTNILIYWYVQPILVLGQDFSMRFRWQERSADRRTCQKSS